MDYVSIGRCFTILHRRSQAFVTAACARLHLTYSEYVLMIRLYDAEGASQEELASMLYLDKAVVTRSRPRPAHQAHLSDGVRADAEDIPAGHHPRLGALPRGRHGAGGGRDDDPGLSRCGEARLRAEDSG